LHRAKIAHRTGADGRVATVTTRREKTLSNEKPKNPLDSDRPSHGSVYTHNPVNQCNGDFSPIGHRPLSFRRPASAPDPMPGNTESVVLTVNGSGFLPQSQILWNGSALQTTFMDSGHLRATITQQTFDSFGGSTGSSLQIAVRSQGSVPVLGCPNGGNSATLVLVIN